MIDEKAYRAAECKYRYGCGEKALREFVEAYEAAKPQLSADSVKQIRLALEGAIDSMEYVNRHHPEATGHGVRAERVIACKAALEEKP